jgi:hypothetical protein
LQLTCNYNITLLFFWCGILFINSPCFRRQGYQNGHYDRPILHQDLIGTSGCTLTPIVFTSWCKFMCSTSLNEQNKSSYSWVKAHYRGGHVGHFHDMYVKYISTKCITFNFGFHFCAWAYYFYFHKFIDI